MRVSVDSHPTENKCFTFTLAFIQFQNSVLIIQSLKQNIFNSEFYMSMYSWQLSSDFYTKTHPFLLQGVPILFGTSYSSSQSILLIHTEVISKSYKMAPHPLPRLSSSQLEISFLLYREYSGHQAQVHLISFLALTNLPVSVSILISFPSVSGQPLHLVPDPIFFDSSRMSTFSYLCVQFPSLHWLLLTLPSRFCLPALQATTLLLLIDAHSLSRPL